MKNLFLAVLVAPCLAFAACTPLQVKDATDTAPLLAPALPPSTGSIVTIAASAAKSALDEYLTAHPEQPADQPIPLTGWGAILVGMLYGGDAKRLLTSWVAKHLQKSAGTANKV